MNTSSELWKLVEDNAVKLPRVLLVGPPGVGKSVAGRELLQPLVPKGKRVQHTSLHRDAVAQELFGFWAPKAGGIEWIDGPLTTAMREGLPLVIDEMGRASSAVLDALLGLLEKPSRVTLPNGEMMEADIPIWGTTNDATMLEPALLDRFDVIVYLESPRPKIKTLLENAYSGLGEFIVTSYADKSKAISPRCGFAFAEFMKSGIEINNAATLAFGPRASDVLSVLKLREFDKIKKEREEVVYA